LPREDFDCSEEEISTDYEIIQNMTDNDSLDANAGKISLKNRAAMITRIKRWQGAKIRDHYPEEISYEKKEILFPHRKCHLLRNEKIG
jgi:hypothetical protein